jgi:hypothetical protein
VLADILAIDLAHDTQRKLQLPGYPRGQLVKQRVGFDLHDAPKLGK